MQSTKLLITKVRLATSLGKLFSILCGTAFFTAFIVRFLGYMKLTTALYIIVASALLNKLVVTVTSKSVDSLISKLKEILKYGSLQQVSFDLNMGKTVVFENSKDLGILKLDDKGNLILQSKIMPNSLVLLNSEDIEQLPELLEKLKETTKAEFFRGQTFMQQEDNKCE